MDADANTLFVAIRGTTLPTGGRSAPPSGIRWCVRGSRHGGWGFTFRRTAATPTACQSTDGHGVQANYDAWACRCWMAVAGIC